MSEALNDVFIDNFQKDPTLTWQYFGSASGFFRLYPGGEPRTLQTPFTQDCETSSWSFKPSTDTDTDSAECHCDDSAEVAAAADEYSHLCVLGCVWGPAISKGFVRQLTLILSLIHHALI